MLEDQVNEMYDDYGQLIAHLREEKDCKGLELVEKLLESSYALIGNIIDKLMEEIKNAK